MFHGPWLNAEPLHDRLQRELAGPAAICGSDIDQHQRQDRGDEGVDRDS